MMTSLGKEVSRGRTLSGTTTECATPCGKLFATINSNKGGDIRETFLTLGKTGHCIQAHLAFEAMLISLYLSSGGKVEKIIKKAKTLSCDLQTPDVKSCIANIALALEEEQERLENGEKPVLTAPAPVPSTLHPVAGKQAVNTNTSGACPQCPTCGARLVFKEGCQTCSDNACGWSKCS